jgi:hypothetical protein
MSTADAILSDRACDRSGCACHTAARRGEGLTHCPAHDDRTPSLSVCDKGGKTLVHCKAGCSQDRVIAALRERGLWGEESASSSGKDVDTFTSLPGGVTIEELAAAKHLPVTHLRYLGLREWHPSLGRTIVVIPYRDHDGRERAAQYRQALYGTGRFFWRKGDSPIPYGLDRLEEARALGWVLTVEGASDCWTAWLYGIPALGIPGKTNWPADFAPALRGVQVFVWQEPAAEDFSERIGRDLPDARIIVAPDGVKDLSEAHIQGLDLLALMEEWKASAVSYEQIRLERAQHEQTKRHIEAAPVLSASDPLVLIQRALRDLGYGGDLRPAMVTYLAATSRVLAMRPGAMLVHLLLLGPAGSGKSYALGVVTRLLPNDAYHVIEAGSPRALIYDRADLRHRLVVFGEADSLPAGEDNPAASAIRNLLQDGFLHYVVTVRDRQTGQYTVERIERPGPSVLVTTSTRRLGEQMDSRVFSLDLSDDPAQLRAVLAAQAGLELAAPPVPWSALIAYQTLLQEAAPWDVLVPFVAELAELIGQQPAAARVARDFARLISLIKSVTVLRHTHRGRTPTGRLEASLEDYEAVYDLVHDLYDATTSGVSDRVRRTVNGVSSIVAETGRAATVTQIAECLRVSKAAAGKRVKTALEGGYLINEETRKGYPYALRLGEPLPAAGALPTPGALAEKCKPVNPVTDAPNGDPAPRGEEDDTGTAAEVTLGEAVYGFTPPAELADDAAIVAVLRRFHRLVNAGIAPRLAAGGRVIETAATLAEVLASANARLPGILAELDQGLAFYEAPEDEIS